jgi:DNA-binding IclR family transcriptional regulator
VYVHLQTLSEYDLVVNENGTYRLSLELLAIGEQIRTQRPVYRHGRGEIESLAKETGELACLGVPEDGHAIVLHSARGEKAAQTISDGTKLPMDASPIGKVLLAFGAVDGGDDVALEESTEAGVPAVDEDLAAELATIREDGFCTSADQSVEDVPYIAEPEPDNPRSMSHRTDVRNRAVAAPVLAGDEPVGAVGVTGPAKRISGDYGAEIRTQVVQTAATIEQKLAVSQ